MYTRVRLPPAGASTPSKTPKEFTIPRPRAKSLKKIMRFAYHRLMTDEKPLYVRTASLPHIPDGCIFFTAARWHCASIKGDAEIAAR
jgi:hypothetical protein